MKDWSRLRPWLVVGIASWLAIGVLLVERANRAGLTSNLNVSPYHLVGYSGLAVLGVYVAWRLLVALRHRQWSAAFPPRYGGIGIGFGLLIGWVVLDPLWQAIFGIGPGLENAIAPTRLLVPLGLAAIATGPLREALATARMNDDGSPRRLGAGSAIAAGVVALGLIGASVSLTALNPVRDPWNDYVVNEGIDMSEIWVMAADGSAQQRLLPARGDGVDYSLPAWSPDGRRVAFTTWTNRAGFRQNWQNADQTSSIWTMAADGSDLVLVVDGSPDQAWAPAWSPDGTWLTYTVSPFAPQPAAVEPQPNGPAAMGPAVIAAGARTWLVHPDGSGAVQLAADAPEISSTSWSPDGTRLAYMRRVGGGDDIFVADFRDGGITNEAALAQSGSEDWGPVWSPDGTRLAFTSDRTGGDDVWLVNVDGSLLTRLTDEPGDDSAPTWSPDGSTIAFVSDRSGIRRSGRCRQAAVRPTTSRTIRAPWTVGGALHTRPRATAWRTRGPASSPRPRVASSAGSSRPRNCCCSVVSSPSSRRCSWRLAHQLEASRRS
jgi:Tol biopolymer transport system component